MQSDQESTSPQRIAMSRITLDFEEFREHLRECGILCNSCGIPIATPTSVAIRTGEGLDFAVAAVHLEGDVLIFDMGHCLENGEDAP